MDSHARRSRQRWTVRLAALVAARPGAKGADKMSAEVIAFAHERLAADPKLS